CATAVFTSAAAPLAGSPPPTASSGNFMATAAGTYRWRATYSGDTNYGTVSAACNAANETSNVSPAATTTASWTTTSGSTTPTRPAARPSSVSLHEPIPAHPTRVPLTRPAGWVRAPQAISSTAPLSCTRPFPAQSPGLQTFTLVVKVNRQSPSVTLIATSATV